MSEEYMKNEQVGQELEWDSEITNTPFTPKIKEGEYSFIVDHFERGKVGSGSKDYAGQNMAIIYCNILTGDSVEPQLKTNLIMNSRLAWKISQFFISIGLMENKPDAKLKMDWNKVTGSRGRCKIEDKPNRNDATKTHSEITEFLPPAAGEKKWGSDF